MNRSLTAFILVTIALAASSAWAKTHSIENKFLVVAYDDEVKTFSVKEKATGKVFLKDGKLDGVGSTAYVVAKGILETTTKEIGRIMHLPRTDGGAITLSLENDSPFLFISGRLNNLGKEQMDITKIVPATFSLDLGKPVSKLRTLGTAGLTAPDKNPGSYLFLTVADPATRRGVVAGWLTHDRGDGVVFSSVKDGKVEFRTQIDYGHLRIPVSDGGDKARITSVDLETLVIGYFDDARLGQEQFADLMAKHYKIKLPPQINGYCTWYAEKHRGAGDEKSIVELAEFAAKELKPFGFSFVQIDDEWQDGGTYNGPRRGFDRVKPNGPYPHGMKPVAEKIRQLGLTPGIWFMPFARNHQDPEYKNRQDWFAKRPNGKPYETAWGGTSLDLTNPEVKAYVAEIAKKIRGWGYTYFKMDGLWTGSATEQIYVNDGYRDDHIGNNAPFHDRTKTNIEVYRSGLKLVREAAGPDVFFSGCNVSQNMRTLGGSIGLVDSMRIGPDNGHDWTDYKQEIAKNLCGSIITGPVRGTRLYFLNGRIWWNDPDPSYVRASIPLKHARLIASWVAISDQFNLNSDWIPGLPNERLDIMKRTMPAHGAMTRPVDYFNTIMPSIWLVTDARQQVRRDVLGLFNWDDKERKFEFAADWAGLDAKKTYWAFDFWNNKPAGTFGDNKFQFDVPGQSCRVIAVRAAEGHPVLVSTSRHVTQGMVDVTDETWTADAQKLSATSQVVGRDAYELRIAGLNGWNLANVSVSDANQAAGVTIEAKPVGKDEGGWLRVVLTSKQSRPVQWAVEFSRAK